MECQTVVKDMRSGKLGVIVRDDFALCEEGEVLVVYEGSVVGVAVSVGDLNVIGPENAVADVEKCGYWLGEKRCKFLEVTAEGVACARFSTLRMAILLRKEDAIAKREPVELYPKCQLD